jgi:protein subunit release factor A
MLELKEVKQKIRDNVKISTRDIQPKGGQHCGIIQNPIVLKSEDLNLEIVIGYHRSQHKNKDLALLLFELTIDELVK